MNLTTQYGKLIDCTLIALLWLLAISVVYPLGNFPLNDDWAYATDVKNLLETGIFNPIGWTSMSLFTHVLWGALWCTIFGFSFEVLRVSTLVISLICLWNIYRIGREIGASRSLARLLAFTLALNPIYFALSFTFMTEVSFMAFISCAVLFFIRFLKNDSIINWCFAVAFCIIATLSRQTGLFLPLSFIFIYFIKKQPGIRNSQPTAPKGESAQKDIEGGGSPLGVRGAHGKQPATRNPQLATHALPFILSFAALKLFEFHMFSTGKIQALYGLQVDELKYLLLNVPEILPLRVLRNMYQASLYLGLMGLPVWGFLAWRLAPRTNDFSRRSTNSATAKVVGTVLFFFPILFLIAVIINDSQMPTLVGILEASGVGPRTLHDTYFLQISTDELPRFFWKSVTYASALGAGLMWALLSCGFLFVLKKEKNNTMKTGTCIRLTFLKCQTNTRIGLFFLLSAAIYFAPFALVGFYDRYLLPLMMVVPLGVVSLWTQFLPLDPLPNQVRDKLPKGETICVPLASPSLEEVLPNLSPLLEGAGERKTLATLTPTLLVILMAIFSITTTHDYLAWNRARWQALHDLTVKKNIPTTDIDGGFEFGGWYNFQEIAMEADSQKSWWWVEEDDYVLTFNEIPDYDIHAEYIYKSWWWGERRIFVLDYR